MGEARVQTRYSLLSNREFALPITILSTADGAVSDATAGATFIMFSPLDDLDQTPKQAGATPQLVISAFGALDAHTGLAGLVAGRKGTHGRR